LIRRNSLNQHEVATLRDLPFHTRSYTREQVIAHAGEAPTDLRVIAAGAAARVKTTWRGQRQILAIYLAGDVIDWPFFRINAGHPEGDRMRVNDSVWALADCTVATFRGAPLMSALQANANLARAFETQGLIDQEIGREWLLNIGSRPGSERVAHLLCELFHRLREVGMTMGDSFRLPLTQASLAETLGMSLVHMNRVLQRLRGEGLVDLRGRTLSLPDPERLAVLADFSPTYLGL
jgi:CRP-like cAMP-binding protein